MIQQEIEPLCAQLQQEFQRDERGRGIAKLFSEYARSAVDWRELVLFDPQRYTRNLLHRSAHYELLLLCWEKGQASPIHDHAGQDCWMAVLEGELEEQHYEAPQAGVLAPLRRGRSARLNPGQVAFIQDGIALHLIRPIGAGRGVSLHLYAKPIDTCRIYEPTTGRPSLVELGYYSVRGDRSESNAAAVRAHWARRD